MMLTGSIIGDYVYCKRKFYLISHGIMPDNDNEDVLIGRIIDEESYPREERDVLLGKNLIDYIGKDGRIHEIKKSSRFWESHRIQLLFYLHTYKLMYGKEIEGILDYPTEKKKILIKLDEKAEREITDLLKEMERILKDDIKPDLSPMYKCRKCSFLAICRG